MAEMQVEEPTDEDAAAVQAVFQAWQANNQQGAVDILRPLADADRPWALALVSWLGMQRGAQFVADGIPYAKRAAAKGMPWVAVNLFNNLIANVQANPDLLNPAIELAESAGPWWTGIDPVGQGWSLASQGRNVEAVRLMSLRSTYPATTDQWNTLASAARERFNEIEAVVKIATDAKADIGSALATGVAAIEKAQTDIETSAKQANLLVSAVVSDSAASLFAKDAKTNESQSVAAWISGLVVLAVAAGVAITPLVLHYVHYGPAYSSGALLGVHAAATAAFATVAGVLLARARTRDLARQRANDMSTAMATMIAYSNQISDPVEKQRFMTTMGQLVLQAHLTAGTGGSADESAAGLVALANLLRPPASGTA